MAYKLLIKKIVVYASVLLNKIGLDVPSIPSVAAIITKSNKILVVDLSYKDGYALPGGAPMKGENLEQALRREVKEETGLEVNNMEYFSSFATQDNGNYSFNVTFRVKANGKLSASPEGKPKWIDPKKAVNNLAYDDNRKAITKYLEKN